MVLRQVAYQFGDIGLGIWI